jgi:ankyrin repeat protein
MQTIRILLGTPRSHAAFFQYEDLVRILLRRDDIDPNIKGWNGETVLWTAIDPGYENIVEVMIESGRCDVDMPNDDDMSPLLAGPQ